MQKIVVILLLIEAVVAKSAIPVFVICFNRVRYVSSIVEQLRRFTESIVLVDNNSSQQDLLAYYNTLSNDRQISVLRMNRNHGHKVLADIMHLVPDVFAMTDPDLRFRDDCPLDMLDRFYSLTEEFRIGKVGVALNVSTSLPIRNIKDVRGYSVRSWESQFWKVRVATKTGLECYKANIDTTLAVYNRRWFRWATRFSALRVAGLYTAIHLPWVESATDEMEYIKTKSNQSGVWLH
jgi:Glycosyl transferase family 2